MLVSPFHAGTGTRGSGFPGSDPASVRSASVCEALRGACRKRGDRSDGGRPAFARRRSPSGNPRLRRNIARPDRPAERAARSAPSYARIRGLRMRRPSGLPGRNGRSGIAGRPGKLRRRRIAPGPAEHPPPPLSGGMRRGRLPAVAGGRPRIPGICGVGEKGLGKGAAAGLHGAGPGPISIYSAATCKAP